MTTKPGFPQTAKKLKDLPSVVERKVEQEVKAMLHAHRDCLRNRKQDTKKISFDCRDGYYGEAFGIMRALRLMGYGYFGSVNLNAVQERKSKNQKHNLKWWFSELEMEVLREEGFNGDGHCKYCLETYHKDDMSLAEKKEMEGEQHAVDALMGGVFSL